MMKLIVAQKHMNLRKLIVVTCSAIGLALSGNVLGAKAAETRSPNKAFADWCRQKANLSPETKHTVEVLLEKAETTECDAANQKLSSLMKLSLYSNQISDIKPLESLTKLTWLDLGSNKISDITPLASLTNLIFLDLHTNEINDIKPLESSTNLTELDLSSNEISDIKPLASLTNLRGISLYDNQIGDIKQLASLTNLRWLFLYGNPIAPKTCPLKPESICNWEPPILLRVPDEPDDGVPQILQKRVERLYLDGGCAADQVRSPILSSHRLLSGGDCREGRS